MGSVNQHTYLAQLSDWLERRLERMSLTGKVWFLQDRTRADCTRPVEWRDSTDHCCNVLQEIATRRLVIARSGQSPRKTQFRKRYQRRGKLQESVRNALHKITAAKLSRMSRTASKRDTLCLEHDGVHTAK